MEQINDDDDDADDDDEISSTSITILTSLLLHKKFTWPDFGRVYIRYISPRRYASGQYC